MSLFLQFLLNLVTADVKYTVSGMSSGGYMAGQLHIAHSSSITGAGLIVSGPYYCTLGQMFRAFHVCSASRSPIDTSPFISYTKSMSAQGLIDPISSLANSTVYIYSGEIDEIIDSPIVDANFEFYKAFVPVNKITYYKSKAANHAWPTKTSDTPCWYSGRPSINNCGFDGSGIVLTTLLGPLYQKGSLKPENLFKFSQNQYADVKNIGMDDFGFVYVPDGCKVDVGKCRVHLNIHGCAQYYQRLGFEYMLGIGMLEWAESNEIVVIFPQTLPTSCTPSGCWDFAACTGKDFALKSGPQVAALNKFAQNYVTIVSDLFK